MKWLKMKCDVLYLEAFVEIGNKMIAELRKKEMQCLVFVKIWILHGEQDEQQMRRKM